MGIIGASKIGRNVIELLRPFDLTVAVADPFLFPDEAAELGVELMELDELMATSDIISVHAPSLPATSKLVSERLIGMLKPGATLINTARSEIVDQEALERRILAGDLFAILDVTTPWVLAAASPLYDHPNVLLTPHIAGSLGDELERLAQNAVDEIERLAQGRELAHPVSEAEMAFTA